MNAPLAPHPTPPYKHTPLFPLGHDRTPYRKLTADGVRVEHIMGQDVVVIPREAMRALAEAAFTDINHLLRPGHLAQLKRILDDPEASDNDHFVAYDFLKNANIAAGGVLPMCQDTGTAIIMGKKGRLVFTDGDDEAALAEGARDAYLKRNLRYSQLAPISMFEEKNTRVEHAGAGRDLCRGRGRARRRIQVPVHRQGRRLGQQIVPVPGDAVDPHARPHAGVPARRRFSRSAPRRARPITSPSSSAAPRPS